ncbi:MULTISPECIES: response regulator [unclassified Methylobacterium]|uniref:response regulator n=1 Tax=unclassified Methylobacterium TaxID=2615210 RepID=UPI0006F91B16|nr:MULTISPECIES: response regulator [unclassified Methylobacterium]KQO74749.1 ATPase [Methylobacterium sp. Leaf89]KQO78224.1 ATPase [Methylobacterium sp. Leaf88]KQT70328.1 ATPase [Methylobacterium sp. Leaf465]KQU18974.1 ATPase [Methylobacterium sp. Leaf94]
MTEATPPRLLLVEDSETQALELRLLLESKGFAVERCATAEAALDQLNTRLPDLVVADHHLPGMNGDEFARQLRLSLRTRALPLLMLTGARDGERQGLESGADAYVAKSADRDLLVLRIRALLRERMGGSDGPGVSAFRRGRVLVVDASATYRTFLAGLLAHEGQEVTTADSHAAAIAALEAAGAAFDCVTIDLLATTYDGLALCRAISDHRNAGLAGREAGAPTFQVVGIAGSSPAKDFLVEAFAAGADDVVSKSDGEILVMRVRSLVRRKLLEEDNRRIAGEFGARERALERARAEAEAAEARAALAGALEQANADLATANRKLTDAQAKLVQAAKMASLGELVAGIAHEINNPLAFILAHQGTVERILGEVVAEPDSPDSPRRLRKCSDRVGAMRMGLTRIQDLVLNLRKFSRLDEGERTLVHVPEAIETVLALIQHKLGDRIAVVRDFAGRPEIHCTPALLNQVVMNILGNAADAMPDSGTITIETRSLPDTDIIRINDTGSGIPETLREKIFEPFFTTKPVGSGTGLGLAIAYSVVQAHSGTLSVEAAPGGGACFVIGIPRQTG